MIPARLLVSLQTPPAPGKVGTRPGSVDGAWVKKMEALVGYATLSFAVLI